MRWHVQKGAGWDIAAKRADETREGNRAQISKGHICLSETFGFCSQVFVWRAVEIAGMVK